MLRPNRTPRNVAGLIATATACATAIAVLMALRGLERRVAAEGAREAELDRGLADLGERRIYSWSSMA